MVLHLKALPDSLFLCSKLKGQIYMSSYIKTETVRQQEVEENSFPAVTAVATGPISHWG